MDAYTLFADYSGLFHFIKGPLWMLTLCLRTILDYFTTSALPLWILRLCLRTILDYFTPSSGHSGSLHFVSGPFWLLITFFLDYTGLFHLVIEPFRSLTLCLRTIMVYFTSCWGQYGCLHFVCGLFWTISIRHRAILVAYTLFADIYGISNPSPGQYGCLHFVCGLFWTISPRRRCHSGCLYFVCGLFWTISLHQGAIMDAYTLFADYSGLFHHVSVPF